MPDYQYHGVDKSGKRVSGKLTAPGEGDLRMMLRGQGIRPTKISKLGALNQDIGSLIKGGNNTVPVAILAAFTRQLQVLIGSGVPVLQSLELLAEQTPDKNLKNIVSAVKEKVAGGTYLWEALTPYPRVFPKIYVSLVRAGESSGSIDQMLKRLSRYLEDADKLRKMLKSAMMYPILVISLGIGVIALMMIFVIPKFEEMLSQAGQDLPLPTQIIIQVSHFMVNNVLYLFVGTIFSIYLFIRYINSPEGKVTMDRLTFHLPVFGEIVQKAGIARFSRTLQNLLSAGVNIVDAIDICKATIDNAVLEEAVAKIRGELESGKSLSTVIAKLGVFPRMSIQMISVGESTGNLDKMLEKVADFYEEEVETAIGGMTKLIEPLILVFLGGSVGGLLIAMYLPIFKLAGGTGNG